MNWQISQRTKRHLLGIGGAIAGIALMIAVQASFERRAGSETEIVAAHGPTVAEVVNRELGWAEQQTSSGLAPRLTPVRDFFNESRQRTRSFAQDALGWDSKWALASDFLTGGKDHARFLEERFAARIFSAEQLEEIVAGSVSAYPRHLDDVDSQLLVRLRADLEDVQPAQMPLGLDRDAIQQAISSALHESVSAVEADFRGMVGQQLVSIVAGDVLGTAAAELAVSAGIIGAGAASGTASFGVSFIVGIIVDAIISSAYDEYFDPAGELAGKVNGALTDLEGLILSGNGTQPGLEGRLRDYALRRSAARGAAIRSAVMPSASQPDAVLSF